MRTNLTHFECDECGTIDNVDELKSSSCYTSQGKCPDCGAEVHTLITQKEAEYSLS